MMDELEGLANRGYTEGFYRRHPPGEYQNYERGASKSDRQQFVGDVLLELVTPSGNLSFELHDIIGRDGQRTHVAPGSGHVVKIPLPESADIATIDDFALLVRYLPSDSRAC